VLGKMELMLIFMARVITNAGVTHQGPSSLHFIDKYIYVPKTEENFIIS